MKFKKMNESLTEKLVAPTEELLKAVEDVFKQNGFTIDKHGKTVFGSEHYQIRKADAIIHNADEIREHAMPLVDALDDVEERFNTRITWNFGADKDGVLTAGLDVREQYIEESLKEAVDDWNAYDAFMKSADDYMKFASDVYDALANVVEKHALATGWEFDERDLDQAYEDFKTQYLHEVELEPEFDDDTVEMEEDFDDDDFKTSEQEFSSKETAHGNGKANGGLGRVPSLFKKADRYIPNGAVVFDYGCGEYNTSERIKEFLADKEVTYIGYDKFNRTAQENSESLKQLNQLGGADIATCANVLNVIKEREIRVNEVIKNIYMKLKNGGTAIFDVYEDKKKAGPKQTGKDKYQLFKGLEDYVEEVAEIFGEQNVEKKGSIILAHK